MEFCITLSALVLVLCQNPTVPASFTDNTHANGLVFCLIFCCFQGQDRSTGSKLY